ncbi:MAG: exodeoxyribonuclease VII small subunit [Clostridia bacterium]|nr:exodeoxyribonuclease VII small subunit [Clostridia bacterium]
MEFEKLLSELQQVVDKLDDPATGLDEGIALFNRGIELSKQCMRLLAESKGKVSLLKKELDAVTSEAFDVDADNN